MYHLYQVPGTCYAAAVDYFLPAGKLEEGVSDGTPTAGEGGKSELPVCFWNYILGLYSQQIEMQYRLVLKVRWMTSANRLSS